MLEKLRVSLKLSADQLKAILPPSFNAYPSLNNEDSFFDAVAQGLDQLKLKEKYDIKALRKLCKTYADNKKNAWIKEMLKKKGISYKDYLDNISFTVEEAVKKQKKVIAGVPEIEGRVICDVLKVEKIQFIELSSQDEDNNNQSFIAYIVNSYGAMKLQFETTVQVVRFMSAASVKLIKNGKHFAALLPDVAQLPAEIISHIFSFFDTPKQVLDKAKVCKKWQAIVHGNYPFWTGFGYKTKKEMIDGELLKTAMIENIKIARSIGQLSILQVAIFGEKESDVKRFFSFILKESTKKGDYSGSGASRIGGNIITMKDIMIGKFHIGFYELATIGEKIIRYDDINPNVSNLDSIVLSSTLIEGVKISDVIFFVANEEQDLDYITKLDCTGKLIFVIAKEEYKKSNGNQIYHYLITDINDKDFDVSKLLDDFVKKIHELAAMVPTPQKDKDTDSECMSAFGGGVDNTTNYGWPT